MSWGAVPAAARLQLAALEGRDSLMAFARAHSGQTISGFIVPMNARTLWDAEGAAILDANQIKLSPA